ncbi:MAG: CotH kinase family protein [Clostridia bacterium]|nr:CotH kinase family protein [Clostridia bacterium]
MKKMIRMTCAFALILIAAVLFAAIPAMAAQSGNIADDLYCRIDDAGAVVVHMQPGRDNGRYLFLPAGADLTALTFTYDEETYQNVALQTGDASVSLHSGVPADISGLCGDAAEPVLTVTAIKGEEAQRYDVILMKSSELRSLHLVSKEPETYGRAYVDQKKSNDKASGTVYIYGSDGAEDFSAKLSQIKGRGNTTFTAFQKKPYQLKLDKKAELIEGAGKAKKWVLLTNSSDPTLMRNAVTLQAAEEMGIAYTSKFEFVDLYYDGEYRGNYMLTEKVEVKENRVEISETDDLIEDANKENPALENPVAVTATRTSGGENAAEENTAGTVKYVKDLIEPAFPTGCAHQAYLLEFEQPVRYPDELTGFVTDRGIPIVTKTPEYMTKDQSVFIASFWQEFEDAVYSKDGYNEKTGKYYYEYCDLDSLVKCYILNEFAKNSDYYFTSTYFYLPEEADMFQCGPVWDYDIAYGIGYDWNRGEHLTSREYFFAAERDFGNGLIQIESFRDEVKKQMSESGEMYAAAHHMFDANGAIDTFAELLDASQRMNFKLWDISNQDVDPVKLDKNTTYISAVAGLKTYASERFQWLDTQITAWEGERYTVLTYTLAAKVRQILSALKQFIHILKYFSAVM